MVQLSKKNILSILFVLYCSMNVYAQRHTSPSEIKEALENLEVHEKELAEVIKFVQSNDEQIKYWDNELKTASGDLNIARIKSFRDELKNESKNKYEDALGNFKIALGNYNASIQWITDLTKEAKETSDRIEGAAKNDSNKKRALVAISNGIKELNGGLSSISPSVIDEIGRLIRMNRRDEEIKEMMLKQVEYKNDKVAIDALIDLLIDAKKNVLGEEAFENKMDGQLGKAMKVVKVLRVFDGNKDNMTRMLDLLDLSSDLPTGNLLTISWYIKIQSYLVENIIGQIDILKYEIWKKNLKQLLLLVMEEGDRIKGDRESWTALYPKELFGKIPPEPSLKLDKSEELPIYEPGTNITVHFEGSYKWISRDIFASNKGWVGLIPSETKHKSSDLADKVDLEHFYLPSEYGKLTFKAPSKLGLYDIRMFDSDPGGPMSGDGLEVASVSFKVAAIQGQVHMKAFDEDGKEINYFVRIIPADSDRSIKSGLGAGLTKDLTPGKYKLIFSFPVERQIENDIQRNIVIIAGHITEVVVDLSDESNSKENNLKNLPHLTYNGSAAHLNQPNSKYITLTNNYWQSGSVFYTKPIDMGKTASFSCYFSFQIDPINKDGADGICFVLQTASNSSGSNGGGIGYQGIKPSMAIEFDTYDNGEINANHIGLNLNGNLKSVVSKKLSRKLEDGKPWNVWIDYIDGYLSVRVGSDTIIYEPVDLPWIFNGESVFVGFTSGTGGGAGVHKILDWKFSSKEH